MLLFVGTIISMEKHIMIYLGDEHWIMAGRIVHRPAFTEVADRLKGLKRL